MGKFDTKESLYKYVIQKKANRKKGIPQWLQKEIVSETLGEGDFPCYHIMLSDKTSAPVKYIAYCGKYSLQFYLFTFCYPIIRWGIVSVMHITNPVVILLSVFILQLITITIIVEISRRIRFLKIPCGY